jgi:hypothetical protein
MFCGPKTQGSLPYPNHIGALWYFIHDYNAQLRMKRGITTVA